MTFRKLTPLALPAALLAALFAGASVRLHAQSAVDGAIGGTVEDQSGAVVPNANVTIHSNGTNAEQKIQSDSSGFFRIIHLTPGSYTVLVDAPGFQAFRSTRVNVDVGALTDPHARLVIGSANDTVNVTSDSPVINTTSPDFANVIDQKILEDLPVNNYRWSAYALLTPGVVEGGGFGLLSFRGQSTLLNNVTFDGADDNQAFFSEERGRTRAGYSTAKSSIQEFQVNTSNYSVEYGRSAGGVVNAVTKSGTNQFHGEAYFYDRDAQWGTKNAFNTRTVQLSPTSYASQIFKPKDVRKQYGIGIGGPIIKDKLFFFFAFDRFNRVFPGISAPQNPNTFYTIPDATLPSGLTCASASLSLQDIAACQLAANLNSTSKSATDPLATANYNSASALYATGIAGLNTVTGTNNRFGDQFIFFPKVDYHINGKNTVSVELNRLRWASPAGIQTGSSAISNGKASFGNDFVKDTFLIAKLDTSITAKLSNEIRYQYGRDFEYEYNQDPTAYEKSNLLNTPNYTNPLGITPNVGIGFLTLGTPTFLNRNAYPDERRFQISDTVNYVRGNHNFKFGGDFLHTNDFSQNLTSIFGSYSYSAANGNKSVFQPLVNYFTDLTANNKCAGGLECYSGYGQGFGPLTFEFQTNDYAGFIQDEWKVTPRLSLTLGVRYEYEQFPTPQLGYAPSDVPTNGAPVLNGSTSVFPSNKTNIGPRVGFAFDVFGTGKTVLRGGMGEFFARAINSTIYNAITQTGNPAGQLSVAFQNSGQNTTLQNPYNGSPTINAPTFPQILPTAILPKSQTAIFYFDKNFKLPEIQQADLTVEQDLGWNTVFSISWLASFGRRLPSFVDSNLSAPTGFVSYTVTDPTGKGPIPNGTVVKTPFYGQQGPAASNGRPDSALGAKTDIFSGVNSNYEAVVFHVTHRFVHNLQFDAHYTWSHALDFGENNTFFTNTNSSLDPRNIRADYGNSNQNVPNRIVMNAIYETPSKFHGILGTLLNKYELSPSYQIQNGNGLSLNVSGSTTGLIVLDGAGNTIPSTSPVNGGFPRSIAGSVNGSGGANRVPNYDRNLLNLPRTQIMDLRLSKRFKIKEYGTMELLGESFNLFNHVNVSSVNNQAYTYGAGTGAQLGTNVLAYNSLYRTTTSANGNFIYTPRQIQVGARFQF